MRQKITTEDDYRKALKRFLEMCDSPDGSDESSELGQIIEQMEEYEQDNCPGE